MAANFPHSVSRFRPRSLFALLLAASLAALPSARAASIVWGFTGTDFSAGGSWLGGVAPGASDIASFVGPANPGVQPVLSANAAVSSLSFSSSTSSGYTLSGGAGLALTLNSNGTGTSSAIYAANTSGTNTINVPVILAGASPTLTGGTLVLNGPISSSSGGDMALTLTGSITLNSANTYTGTTLGSGTISIASPAVFGTSTLVVAGGTRTLKPLADITGANKLMNPISLQGGGLTVSGGAMEFGGNITVGAGTNTIGAGASSFGAYYGLISGPGSVVFSGGGNVYVTAANTFTGSATISGGNVVVTAIGNAGSPGPFGTASTLSIQSNGTLVYQGPGETTDKSISVNRGGIQSSGSGPLILTSPLSAGSAFLNDFTLGGTNTDANTVSGVISGGSSNKLIKDGAGLWIFAAENTFTGLTVVQQGTLRLAPTAKLGPGSLSVTGGTLDINSTIQIVGGGLDVSGGSIISTGEGGTLWANGFNVAAGIIHAVLGSGAALNKTGTGVATLDRANTYSGKTSIQSGTLIVNSIGNVGGGNSALGAPTTVASGTIDFGVFGAPAPPALQYIGPAASSDRLINLAGNNLGGTIDSSGTGPLSLTGGMVAPTTTGSKVFYPHRHCRRQCLRPNSRRRQHRDLRQGRHRLVDALCGQFLFGSHDGLRRGAGSFWQRYFGQHHGAAGGARIGYIGLGREIGGGQHGCRHGDHPQ